MEKIKTIALEYKREDTTYSLLIEYDNLLWIMQQREDNIGYFRGLIQERDSVTLKRKHLIILQTPDYTIELQGNFKEKSRSFGTPALEIKAEKVINFSNTSEVTSKSLDKIIQTALNELKKLGKPIKLKFISQQE